MDAHVQECAEVCGVISSLAGRRRSSRRCCWGRNEKAAVGRQRLFLRFSNCTEPILNEAIRRSVEIFMWLRVAIACFANCWSINVRSLSMYFHMEFFLQLCQYIYLFDISFLGRVFIFGFEKFLIFRKIFKYLAPVYVTACRTKNVGLVFLGWLSQSLLRFVVN